jgi:catalase
LRAVADPDQAIAIINARFGRHARARALHAKGVWARGTFTASEPARSLSRAAHLQGDAVGVLVRLSNGGGDPGVADYVPDVRGLAVKFELPDGSKTDLVSQSVPKFFARTPDEFLAFIAANTGRGAALKLPRFLATHPKALRGLPVNARALRPIPSFANCRFYGVHAFRWVDADGAAHHVRCDWRPDAGDERIGGREAKALGPDYLREDLERRLAAGAHARWNLDVQIAEPGDPVDDPSAHWPSSRRRVFAGLLALTEVVDDPETDGTVVVFDPSRVTDGIELTADPVLAFRPAAYSASVERRME